MSTPADQAEGLEELRKTTLRLFPELKVSFLPARSRRVCICAGRMSAAWGCQYAWLWARCRGCDC